jgi:hypothetical protein
VDRADLPRNHGDDEMVHVHALSRRLFFGAVKEFFRKVDGRSHAAYFRGAITDLSMFPAPLGSRFRVEKYSGTVEMTELDLQGATTT